MAIEEQVIPPIGQGEAEADAGPAKWERWTKKRVFVRALEGTYGQLKEELFNQPRVYHTKDWSAEFRQESHQPAGGQGCPVDRMPHRRLCARRLRSEARPYEQRRVLRSKGKGT
jgi:hypothetical protein